MKISTEEKQKKSDSVVVVAGKFHQEEVEATSKISQNAPSGNRTQGISMATRYFTTKPMVLTLCLCDQKLRSYFFVIENQSKATKQPSKQSFSYLSSTTSSNHPPFHLNRLLYCIYCEIICQNKTLQVF